MGIVKGMVIRILIKALLLGAVVLSGLYLVDINFFKN